MTEVWTYYAANVIQIEGDVTSKYWVGSLIYITQASADKFFIITAVSVVSGNTRVTVNGGGTYTLTNDAITSHFINRGAIAPNLPLNFQHQANIVAATAKTALADSDNLQITDSAANHITKKVTWASVKSSSKTYFDTLYSLTTHNHDAAYSAIGHNHTGVYSLIGHDHNSVYSLLTHDHNSSYAALSHTHTGVYSPVSHNHDTAYAALSHTHSGVYSLVSHNHDSAYSALGHTHSIFSGYDVIIYQNGGNIIAENGWTHAVIDSGTIGSTVNTRVIKAAITACPVNGSMYMAMGTYYVTATTSCTAGPAGYLTYNVAIPISKNIHIFGAGMGATILKLSENQHYTDHPALIMYVFHPYSDGGFGTAYTSFELADMTFDGNKSAQTVWHYDGAGLLLLGSIRRGGVFRNLEFMNSADSGVYWGNHGAGWEVDATINNIVSHDNADFDQIDNPENVVLNGYIGKNNGNGWNHIGLIIDTMDTGHRSITASDINLKDCHLFIFGIAGAEPNPDAMVTISNLNIDNSDTDCNCIVISDFGNVSINGGRIRAKSDTNYGIDLRHASKVEVSNLAISGFRGVVGYTSTVNSINLKGCTIEATSHVMLLQPGDVYNFYGCYLATSDAAANVISAAASRTIGVYNCVGNGVGLVASTGTINHVGTIGLGLEAFGSVTNLADGATIAHGLKVTPRWVDVISSSDARIISISVDATNITVHIEGAATMNGYWHARY